MGTLDYSELLGIMKQMQQRITAQSTPAHELSENLENKLTILSMTLDTVTHVMKEKRDTKRNIFISQER